MVNPNDLNFNDVICFVACTKNEVNLGFLSQTVPKLCLRHLKVFTNRFYGLWGLSGKPSKQYEFLFL